MPPTLEARGLTKRFRDRTALDALDLTAEPGQVVALLGPNGAGKTTFIRTVATLLAPDAGQLRIHGVDVIADPAAARRLIGLAGQYAAVEPAMTGRENLVLVARLFGRPRRDARAAADAVLEQLSLGDHADELVRTYSGGLRRRLDLGASLVGSPRLLLLDEPTTGLDPRSRLELWEAIRSLVAGGTDVLLTTQYLEEADHLASHVVIIDHGRVIAEGRPADLKRRAGRDVVEAHARTDADIPAVAAALGAIGASEPQVDAATRRVTVPVDDGTESLLAAVHGLAAADLAVDDLGLRHPTLDEVFLTLTGRPADTDDLAAQPA